jgi:hypothetical protein
MTAAIFVIVILLLSGCFNCLFGLFWLVKEVLAYGINKKVIMEHLFEVTIFETGIIQLCAALILMIY